MHAHNIRVGALKYASYRKQARSGVGVDALRFVVLHPSACDGFEGINQRQQRTVRVLLHFGGRTVERQVGRLAGKQTPLARQPGRQAARQAGRQPGRQAGRHHALVVTAELRNRVVVNLTRRNEPTNQNKEQPQMDFHSCPWVVHAHTAVACTCPLETWHLTLVIAIESCNWTAAISDLLDFCSNC